jgi:hypothetical protein
MRLRGFALKPETSRDVPQTGDSQAAADDDVTLRFIVLTADEEFYLRLQQIAGRM